MLRSLSISNYILIENLQIDFSSGFTTVTGETGAGKSIILGALSLVTGERADSNLIRDREKKCVVEAVFSDLTVPGKDFFLKNNIDHQPELILRREILPAGTSRAFINDCPVTLQILKEAGKDIIDIHSQHQNLLLNNNRFQLAVIDSLAGNQKLLGDYGIVYEKYIEQKKELEELVLKHEQSQKDLEYITFQYNQLNESNLKEGEQEELEAEQKILGNAGEITETLNQSLALISENSDSIIVRLKNVRALTEKIKNNVTRAGQWQQRLESVLIELRDISGEIETVAGRIDVDPKRLDAVNERLSQIYSLLFKFKEKDINALVKMRDDYRSRIDEIENYSGEIEKLKKEIAESIKTLDDLSGKLSKKRKQAVPVFGQKISAMASDLGMPHASITCDIRLLSDYAPYGKDDLRFMFTSNPQIPVVEISKAASGGELSRIMLSLKTLLAASNNLPTLIFDEIDTGLSGEIAHKMSMMMKQLSSDIQVIAITHLPQIAAAGKEHILVYKVTGKNEAHTFLKKLDKEERLSEIAKMLSGKKVTPAAMKNAEEMIRQSK